MKHRHAGLSAQQVLLRQVELEIAIRRRIAELAKSKIAFAKLVQNAVITEEPDPSMYLLH